MGTPIFENFGVDVADLIKQNLGQAVLTATLIKRTSGTRTAGNLTGGTNPTEASFSCRGFIDRQARRNQDGSLVDDGTVTIVLIGDTIDSGDTAPELGDRITIEGTTYQVPEDGAIDRDPAAATYTITARPL